MGMCTYTPATASWRVSAEWRYTQSTANRVRMGTSRVEGIKLLENAMNNVATTVYDRTYDGKQVVNPDETAAAREKQEALQDAFEQWVWKDEERAKRLLDVYNREFNSWVPRQFDGSHLTLPGYSQVRELDGYQRNAIWRIVSSARRNNTLLGLPVGAGKTLIMVCAAMELRRMGLARKPLFAVPNHMLEQFASEFMQAYPSARLLVPGPDDMTPQRRDEFVARAATSDWDSIILTHSMFGSIPADPDQLRCMIEGELAELESLMSEQRGDRNSRTLKDLVRQSKDLKARLTKLSPKTDGFMGFSEMGVDFLFVDEAHLFKNLIRQSRMERVAGLSSANSARAFDLLVKSREIGDRFGPGRLVFATATFVANTMAELWVMQKYLQAETLRRKGLLPFDAWANSYGKVVTSMELAPDGASYRMNRRFAKFINMPELMGMFGEVAEVRTIEELGIERPSPIRENLSVEASPALKAFVQELVKRAESLRSVKPHEDNMLKITGDGRRAALDMRLVDPGAAHDPAHSKISLCASRVHELMRLSEDYRGAQLVFCDQGTPSGGFGFNAYQALKDELVAKGAPEDSVVFIHDYETQAAKASLFRKVRSGEVRVLIGSTEKMGVGTNVQERLVALHHLDAPWRPADIEQREGRILRRGNTCAQVYICRYVTEGSFDAYIWQTLESKARFIAQVMSRQPARSAEDADAAALTYAEVKALASGNPHVLRKATVDAEIARLSALQRAWRNAVSKASEDLMWLDVRRKALEQRIEAQGQALAALQASPHVVFRGGVPATDERSASAAILAGAALGDFEVARVGGMPILGRTGKSALRLTMKLPGGVDLELGTASSGAAAVRLTLAAAQTVEQGLSLDKARLKQLNDSEPKLRELAGGTFEHAARLRELLAEQAQLERALGLFEQVAGDPDAE